MNLNDALVTDVREWDTGRGIGFQIRVETPDGPVLAENDGMGGSNTYRACGGMFPVRSIVEGLTAAILAAGGPTFEPLDMVLCCATQGMHLGDALSACKREMPDLCAA